VLEKLKRTALDNEGEFVTAENRSTFPLKLPR